MTDKKTLLITGASSGIGKEIARKFHKEGFTVAGISRNKPEDSFISWYKADITNENEMKSAFDNFINDHNQLDLLINNAGIGHYGTWIDSDENEIRRVIELNFFANISLVKLAFKHLKLSKGTIILTSSVAGTFHVPCMGPYCASKYALNAFADTLRAEIKPHGIHLLNLIVGRINTGFSSRSLGKMTPPSTPGSGSAVKLAEKVFRAFIKRRRYIIYPSWYRIFKIIPILFPVLYDKLNLKKWKLS